MAENARDKEHLIDGKKETASSPKHDISDTAMTTTDGEHDVEAFKFISDREPDSV
jgi:hypothetical protein